MATQFLVTVDAHCACQKVLAQGRLLRMQGLFQAYTPFVSKDRQTRRREDRARADSKPPS